MIYGQGVHSEILVKISLHQHRILILKQNYEPLQTIRKISFVITLQPSHVMTP